MTGTESQLLSLLSPEVFLSRTPWPSPSGQVLPVSAGVATGTEGSEALSPAQPHLPEVCIPQGPSGLGVRDDDLHSWQDLQRGQAASETTGHARSHGTRNTTPGAGPTGTCTCEWPGLEPTRLDSEF